MRFFLDGFETLEPDLAMVVEGTGTPLLPSFAKYARDNLDGLGFVS